MEENKQQKDDFGAMAGIIIVVILLLVGALYFGKQRIEQRKQFKSTLQEATSTISTSTINI